MTQPDDHMLDARLRDVPSPAGIARRVAPEMLFDDVAIDRLLLHVDLPEGLQDRTRRAMATMREGSTLPLPSNSKPSGPAGSRGSDGGRQASPSRRTRLWPAAMDLFADGAAVAAALSIVALMFLAGTELSRRLAPPQLADRVATPKRQPGRPNPSSAPMVRREAGGGLRSSEPPMVGMTGSADGRRPPAAAPLMAPPETPRSDASLAGDARHAVPSAPTARAAVEVRAAPAAAEFADGGDRGSRVAGIRTVILPATGRHVPRVPAYDIAFEMAHGEAPFIDPSRAAELALDRPPLSLRTDSFDSLCVAASRGHGRSTGRPSRRGGMVAVRVEDILAALPAAPEVAGWQGPGLGLSVDAVRSLRASPGSLLVEVCVAAPTLAAGRTAAGAVPLDAMLVLDQSAGPFASLSWQWLCRGLRRVVGQMGPADRLSLVVCGERPRLVALRADAATLTALLPELMREPMARFADFDAAFRLVAAVGRREGRPDRIVAAAHADSLDRCRAEGRAALSEWQATVASASTLPLAAMTEFVLIDPQQPLDTAGSTPVAALAGRIAADPTAIARAMMGRVFARPTLAATGCRLEVAFDPRRVESYRIVGHRQTAADALAGIEPLPIDLHAGETVRVVYEVVTRPGQQPGVAADFLTATLAWTSADASADGLHREQRVRRGLAGGVAALAHAPRTGLPPPHDCELLLAVELGQLAAASVHAEPWRQSAAEILMLVSGWQARGDLTPMGGLLVDCLEFQGIVPDAVGR